MNQASVGSEIQTMVVEDDAGVRAMLAAVFAGTPGFRCLGAFDSAESALRRLQAGRPDVLLLDIELPKRSGLELLRDLRDRWPDLLVVILSVHGEPQTIFEALKQGAAGYLLKPTTPARIVEAVAEAHGGGAPMSAAIARLVLRTFRERARRSDELAALTGREHEVLKLVSEGYLPEEVADQLKLSRRTIGTHLQSIYRKLHVRTRSQAVARFFASGGLPDAGTPQAGPA